MASANGEPTVVRALSVGLESAVEKRSICAERVHSGQEHRVATVPELPPLAAEIERLKKELAKRDAEIERLQLEIENLRDLLLCEAQ